MLVAATSPHTDSVLRTPASVGVVVVSSAASHTCISGTRPYDVMFSSAAAAGHVTQDDDIFSLQLRRLLRFVRSSTV